MIKYIGYIYKTLIKRPSTYIIAIMGVGMSCILFYVSLHVGIDNGVPKKLSGISTHFYFLPFVFGSLFVSVKALNIFKDGELDGSELLIASKRLSRSSIVMGKFLSLYSMIGLYSFLMFVGTYGVATTSAHDTSSAKIAFALSNGLGGMIIMILLSSFIIFISSYMGKIASLTLSILLPAALPIVSFVLAPIGGGSGASISNLTERRNLIVSRTADTSEVYDIETDLPWGIKGNDSETKSSYEDYKQGFYKNVSFVDVWTHLNGFYKMFDEPVDLEVRTAVTSWSEVDAPKKPGLLGMELYPNPNDRDNKEAFALSVPYSYDLTKEEHAKKVQLILKGSPTNDSAIKTAHEIVNNPIRKKILLTALNSSTMFNDDKNQEKWSLRDALGKVETAFKQFADMKTKSGEQLGSSGFSWAQDSDKYISIYNVYSNKDKTITTVDEKESAGFWSKSLVENRTMFLLVLQEMYKTIDPLTTHEEHALNTTDKYYMSYDSVIKHQWITVDEKGAEVTPPAYNTPYTLRLHTLSSLYGDNVNGARSEHVGGLAISEYRKVIQSKPWVNKASIIVVYSILILLASAGVFYRYMKRDFK